ncbi:hypothetical protein [Pseudonocardia sp. ICBG601]|uniref:hypothetical protein n=1 Tax=Pseudonocardia sp. ICBG601 TaxID=2846759 RepID=UPI001CF68AB6|nr:hypothetical protein [Pseudonocardia sp. ICBG601]
MEAKTSRARRLAVRDAAAVIDTEGTAALAYRPGTYQVHRRALAATAAPERPVTPVAPVGGGRADDWDWALAALVEGAGCVDSRLTNDLDYEADPALDSDLDCLDSDLDSHLDDDHGGGVAVLDRRDEESGGESRADLRQSTHPRSSSTPGVGPDHDLETGSTPAAWMIFATSSGQRSTRAASTPARPNRSAGHCAAPLPAPANSATRSAARPEARDEQRRP